jgi:NTE family protein
MNLNRLFHFNIGLVLSGGGAKGAYQIGVFKALYELHLQKIINIISGTSIGALNGALFLMDDYSLLAAAWEDATYDNFMYLEKHQHTTSFKDAIRSLLDQKWEDISFHDYLLNQNLSLFSQAGLEKIIDKFLDFEKIHCHNKKLFVCAYNTTLRKPEYFLLNTLDAATAKKTLLASAAIPFMYEGVKINEYTYSDGGLNNPLYEEKNSDNVPFKPVFECGCNIIILVHLDYEDCLDPTFHDGKTTFIEIYPSTPLENWLGTGTMNFRRHAVAEKITLGYRDAMVIIAPLLIKILLGKKFTELVAEHNFYNQQLLAQFARKTRESNS